MLRARGVPYRLANDCSQYLHGIRSVFDSASMAIVRRLELKGESRQHTCAFMSTEMAALLVVFAANGACEFAGFPRGHLGRGSLVWWDGGISPRSRKGFPFKG